MQEQVCHAKGRGMWLKLQVNFVSLKIHTHAVTEHGNR